MEYIYIYITILDNIVVARNINTNIIVTLRRQCHGQRTGTLAEQNRVSNPPVESVCR